MLNDSIQNILSVLYILKKIEFFKDSCYEKAYADKDKPNNEERLKYEKALHFREELSQYVSNPDGENYDSIEAFL